MTLNSTYERQQWSHPDEENVIKAHFTKEKIKVQTDNFKGNAQVENIKTVF